MAQNIKKLLKKPLFYLSPLALTGCSKTTNNLGPIAKSVHWYENLMVVDSKSKQVLPAALTAANSSYDDDSNPYEEIVDSNPYEIPKRSLNPSPAIKRERAAAEKRQRQAEEFSAIEAQEAAVRNVAEEEAKAKIRAEIREKAATAAEQRQKKAEEKISIITIDLTMEILEEIEITKTKTRPKPSAQAVAEEEQRRIAQRQKALEVGTSIAKAVQQRKREEREKKRKLAAVQSIASTIKQIESPIIAAKLTALLNRKKAEQIQREKLAKHNNRLIQYLKSARKYVSCWCTYSR